MEEAGMAMNTSWYSREEQSECIVRQNINQRPRISKEIAEYANHYISKTIDTKPHHPNGLMWLVQYVKS